MKIEDEEAAEVENHPLYKRTIRRAVFRYKSRSGNFSWLDGMNVMACVKRMMRARLMKQQRHKEEASS
jgi:hypothetical protein